MSEICETESYHETHCFIYGAKDLDSDIDISLSGCKFFTNVKALMIIIGIVHNINIFGNEDRFNEFFDIHFYLSNFAIIIENKYIISTDYSKQLSYALASHKEFDKAAYFDLAFRIAQHLNEAYNKNDLIDLISQLSLYERDSYKTQGAFFHVVLILQKGLDVPMTDEMYQISCLENLCFANLHFEYRCSKYMFRMFDALNRMSCKNNNVYDTIILAFPDVDLNCLTINSCKTYIQKIGQDFVKQKLQDLIITLGRNNTPILLL